MAAAVLAGGAEVAALVLVQMVRAANVQHAQEAVKVDLVRVCRVSTRHHVKTKYERAMLPMRSMRRELSTLILSMSAKRITERQHCNVGTQKGC